MTIVSCKKKDWRDSFIAGYAGSERHEIRVTNYVTGQAYSYVRDSVINTSVNIELIKNGKSNQITIRLDGVYYCDADKDGFTNKSNATAYFTPDSVKVIEYLPSDTFHFGRLVWVGKKN